MPCYKCNNGKYKYGERGRCQFDTLGACEAAERAIHARENEKSGHMPKKKPSKPGHMEDGEGREEPNHNKKPKKPKK